MSLFTKSTQNSPNNNDKKTSLFGGKNNGQNSDETEAAPAAQPSIVLGGNGTSSAGTGDGFAVSAVDGDSRQNNGDGGAGGNGAGGNGSPLGGLFALSVADSGIDGDDGDSESEDIGTRNESRKPASSDDADSSESVRNGKPDSRPSFLSFSSAESKPKTEEPKDVKIQKQRGRKPGKNGEYLSAEQVEVAFIGLFDAIALFKGNHWKLQKDEAENVVPSLARIINRVLDKLPKGISNHAFNVFDILILLAAIGAIIVKRTNFEKELKRMEAKGEIKFVGGEQPKQPAIGVQDGNEKRALDDSTNGNQPSQGQERVQAGVSSVAPIKDLAGSIGRIS